MRPKNQEAAVDGAMLMGGLGMGQWSSLEALADLWEVDRVFEPEMARDEAERLYVGWIAARDLTKGWLKRAGRE